MKKFLQYLLISSILIVNGDAKDRFLWVDDEDYKPYIYKDHDGKPKGVFKDLMVEIFKRMDIPLEYQLYPWKRSQKYVQDGKADGMVTVVTKKRLEFTIPTDPLINMYEKIFTRKDNPRIKEIMNITDISQFKGFKVLEYIGAGWAEEHFKDLDMVWVPKQTNALIMLANKRGDIYVTSEFIGISNIKDLIKANPKYANNLKKLVATKTPLTTLEFSLLIQKDSKFVDIIPKFNETLKEMKKDGTYDKIVNKYLNI